MDYYDEIDESTSDNDVDFNMEDIYGYLPCVSYQYIELQGEYSFFTSECSIDDYQRYFRALKTICSNNIKYWEQAKYGENHHFKLETTTRNPKIINLLNQIAAQSLSPENFPIIGHFHLAKREPSNPAEDYKPIVVHFFLGQRGQFFVIALDLHHEIHKPKTK